METGISISPIKKRNKLVKNTRKYNALLVMMLPATIVLLVNSYLPMFGVIIAFKDVNYQDGIFGSPWIGLKNFKFLFSSSDAWVITRNTVLYNVAFIALGIVGAVSIAILLNEVRKKWLSKLYQTIIIMPNFLSMVVVSYIVYAFLNSDYGFINKGILAHLGMKGISWYSEPKYWPFILPIVNLWKGVGMGSVIYLAAIVGIDEEYYEAAIIDGASKWQQIKYITLPLISPVIVIMTILSMGGIFRSDFGLFYQVTLNSGALYPTTNVIDTYVYRALMNMNDIGMSSAAGFYQSVVGMVLVLFTNWIAGKVDKERTLF